MIRPLNSQELDAVRGGNGVTQGPNGEGCIPPLLPPPPGIPGLQEWLDGFQTRET